MAYSGVLNIDGTRDPRESLRREVFLEECKKRGIKTLKETIQTFPETSCEKMKRFFFLLVKYFACQQEESLLLSKDDQDYWRYWLLDTYSPVPRKQKVLKNGEKSNFQVHKSLTDITDTRSIKKLVNNVLDYMVKECGYLVPDVDRYKKNEDEIGIVEAKAVEIEELKTHMLANHGEHIKEQIKELEEKQKQKEKRKQEREKKKLEKEKKNDKER